MDFADESRTRAGRAGPPAAVVCGAALFYFGTGLAPVAALTWLAPLPALLLAPRVSARVAAGVGFLAYLLGTANSWSWYATSHDVPLLPMGLLISAGLAGTFTAAVLLFRGLVRRGWALPATLAAPAVWVGVAYLASFNPAGISGTLAETQADLPWVLQTAAVTGRWGVDYLVLLVPSAIAALLAPATPAAARARTATATAVVLMAALGGGTLRMANESNDPAHHIALIAHNRAEWPGRGSSGDVGTPAGREFIAGYVDEIAELPDTVELVVLPEAAFFADQADPPALIEPMRAIAGERGIDLVVGLIHRAGDTKYNYALTFPAHGGDPVAYLKHHDMVSPPGDELVFPATAGAGIGVAICADVNFPNPSRDYATAGATLLAIPASDEDDNGWQHSRTALLRGVENGQAIAWGGRQTTLLLADGYGRVLAEQATGGPAEFSTTMAEVPAGPGATLYSRLGDWFAWLCLALVLGGVVAVARRTPAGGAHLRPSTRISEPAVQDETSRAQ